MLLDKQYIKYEFCFSDVYNLIKFSVLPKDQPRRKRVDAWGDKMMEQKDMSLLL